MLHPDREVYPIDYKDIPDFILVKRVDNTGNLLKDGYYVDINENKYYHYITEANN